MITAAESAGARSQGEGRSGSAEDPLHGVRRHRPAGRAASLPFSRSHDQINHSGACVRLCEQQTSFRLRSAYLRTSNHSSSWAQLLGVGGAFDGYLGTPAITTVQQYLVVRRYVKSPSSLTC